MHRRTFLKSAALAGPAATAGCLSEYLEQGPVVPPTVTGRPDAVYVPSHVEGMKMAGMGTAGGYKVGLTYSYPHRFWLVTNEGRSMVGIKNEDSVHLMVGVWDPETGAVPPAGSISAEVTKDGESVDSRELWPMLSQNMGFHYGDNVPLSGNGTYEVTLSVSPVTARRTGAFRGKFAERGTVTLPFEFSQERLNEVMYKRFEEKQGQPNAVAPMEMEMMPTATTPERSALPGTLLGEGTSGDAVVVATLLADPPDGVDGEGPYLAVSPRTPYNRYPLPFMSLTATVGRDGSTAAEFYPRPTFDPDLGYHYGATADLRSGDELTLSVDVPPQLARHEGYETAFFEMGDVTMTV